MNSMEDGVGDRRAAVGAAPDSQDTGCSRRLVVVLRIGDLDLALDAAVVREIVQVEHVTTLPFAERGLVGAASLRGSFVPLFDMGPWAGVSSDADRAGTSTLRYAAVVDCGDGRIALETREVPTMASTESEVRHRQPLSIGDRIVIGVDPDAFIQQERAVATTATTGSPPVGPANPISERGNQ